MEIKKIILAMILSLLAASSLQAQEDPWKPEEFYTLWRDGVELELRARIRSIYKSEDDYQTPLDSYDRLGKGISNWHGADNRSKQNTRNDVFLRTILKAGPRTTQGIDWYHFVGLADVYIDVDKPDHSDTGDSERKTLIEGRNTWLRYSPFLPVGITIGNQGFKSTSNAIFTHIPLGDIDRTYYGFTSASTLRYAPGIKMDFCLSKDFNVMVGRFEDLSEGSQLAAGVKGYEAENYVVGMQGKLGPFGLNAAYQYFNVGGRSEEEEPYLNTFDQDKSGSVFNTALTAEFKGVKTWLTYQRFSGEKQVKYFPTESDKYLVELMGVGGQVSIGPGELSLDYTNVVVPDFEEKGYTPVFRGVSGNLMVDYVIPFNEWAHVGFFYYQRFVSDDDGRENMEAQLRQAGSPMAAMVDQLEWSESTSVGVQFVIEFGRIVGR